MSARVARWLAWSIVVIFVILGAAGLTLQFLADRSYANINFPVLALSIAISSVWPFIGALIISRHPRHPVGWLLSLGIFVASFDMFAGGYVSYDTQVYPGSLPLLAPALVWLTWSGFPFATTALTLMVLLFPDGRFLSPGWRRAAWAAVVTLFLYLLVQVLQPGPVDPLAGFLQPNPLGVSPLLWATLEPLQWVSYVLLEVCYLAALVSLVVRLRGAQGEVRQQVKWLLLPAALYSLNPPLIAAATVLGDGWFIEGGIIVGIPAIMGIVIATAIAIFKYRLYDIDVIVNRTLVYGALTASVVLIYVLVVGGLGALVRVEGNLFVSLLATGLIAVLFQPLRERLQRAVNRLTYGQRDEPFEALSRLGRRLETTFSPAMVYPTIAENVAQALKLPYVALDVKRGDHFETAESRGSPPGESVEFPLSHQGQIVGLLRVGRRAPDESFSPADERLLRGFARQAGTAVHAVQLTVDLQHSRQQLVSAREEERRRLRRDLHDGLGPALASVAWQSESAREMVFSDPAGAVQLLESTIAQAQEALADIRRLVYDLRPPALDELGLVGALEQASRQYQRLSVAIEAPASLPSLPAAVEVAAYRITQEALKNAVQHGRATNCAVTLSLDRDLTLAVVDDGLGLPDSLTQGIGLVSMRERAEELGGEFDIRPRGLGGAEVTVHLPLKLEKAP